MALVNKQDSNFTGLRYAVEATPGVLPATPVWVPLEPNSYKDFGGDVTTKARNPINASRQRKKGVVTDLDASGGYESDITPTNVQDIMQTFLFAALRRKSELQPQTVNHTSHDYEPAAGGAAYVAGDLLFAKGAFNPANDGLKVVTGTPTGTSIVVTDTNVVDEVGNANLIVSRVGHQFGAGVLSVDVSGEFPAIVASGIAAAHQALTTTGAFSDGETVTIGTKVYTIQTVLTNTDGHVLKGASAAVTLTNLKNAINLNGLGVPGVDYAASTTVNTQVTAATTASILTVTAILGGTVGNTIATTTTAAAATWGAATLAGGTSVSLKSFGLIPGEPIFVGGDLSSTQFLNPDSNAGYCRVRSVTDSQINFDKTQFPFVTDAGTAKTVQLFFGRVLKNESVKDLIVRRSVQLERTLGAVDDSQPDQEQAEYLTRCLGDEWELDGKTADILVANYSYLAGTYETRDSATGVKPGLRPDIEESDAFNTTSDVSLIKMAVVTPGNSCPTPLFGFLTDLKLSLKNNLKQNKAISVLGAFDVSAGTLEVQLTVTAYFSSVDSVNSVRNNDSVTVEAHFAKANKGLSIDLPLVALSKSRADVKQDEPITLPLTADAATAALIDPTLNHTIMMVFWDYLPDAAQ